MKLENRGQILRVLAVKELGAANAKGFRDWVRDSIEDGHTHLEIDLSQTTFVDSCGLGALVALHKAVAARDGKLRLLNPQPAVRQLLELTRLNHVFEVVSEP